MVPRGVHCIIGNHVVHGQGVNVTNRHHIAFIKKLYPEFRPQQLICRQCKQFLEHAYNYKYQHAMEKCRRKLTSEYTASSLSTTNSSDISLSKLANTEPFAKTYKAFIHKRTHSSISTSDDEDDDRPTTSAAAAAIQRLKQQRHKQKRLRQQQIEENNESSLDQQIISINPDITRLYLRGIIGG